MAEDTVPVFDTLAVIGPGLIGSSVLRRAQAEGNLVRKLIAVDQSPDVCARVAELGIADEVTTDAAAAAAQADCVMLCVPVGAMGAVAAQVVPAMKPGAILTDVGSTKVSVIEAIRPSLRADVPYVPTHPMAGTEFSGPDAGLADLFENRWCLMTPLDCTTAEALEKMRTLWELCGARLREMTPAHHDRVCAIVSHLPHLLAFTICGTADDLASETRSEVLDFAASGFRDFTRIAASDPIMWRDIFLSNREALLEMLGRFMEDAQAMARAIRWEDSDYIVDRIERGRKIRKSLIENKQA
ncbi:prephenate/arogenate dehydrogenase family protein [Acetobacter sp. DmW_125133]|uniref:prephenate dehydrogenase n=2 Tax=Acetobacter TaxID=434 RepID=A0AAN1PJG3_9PROT|nr:cyclohexadienyl dehydrogenase [Acetobacter oryzifermentans]AXN01291.1 cyclohexadienyl dehydrogenase [Acetobacter pomorum]KAA8395084.1 prephenate/arogenate dehydrogenase family protein [Acetobacter sp. DmW_125128]KAA8395522.1 prephenate/arogenate dehydrogenase family protein [Acetobacter sp. DmW_125124]KAA8399873.1 prephenate/arogenate dehydrogenase family protein [Acetobacter sp. DmW_125127]KAA8403725.1 prephenate/arogenate dehydrogenase family protein [Acetobacter sp. DmW_125132]KAA840871